jgi:O-acetylhomoserine/O-acetylserine sulfhydrylase-like pyridoxal-dependent enzyme
MHASILQIKSKANHLGGSLDPHGAFLLHRGVKTLALRVERQNANAAMLAAALEKHPQVQCTVQLLANWIKLAAVLVVAATWAIIAFGAACVLFLQATA